MFWYNRLSCRAVEKVLEENYPSIQLEAENGSAKAMFLLGRYHHIFESDHKHIEQAKECFRKAA